MKKQLTKFIIVGIVSSIINYSFFYLLLSHFLFNYLLSSSIGFLCGMVIGFILNKNWTYDSKSTKSLKIIHKYIFVYLFSLLLSLIFLKITVEIIGINAEIANILAIFLTTCTNFVGTKFIVFKK